MTWDEFFVHQWFRQAMTLTNLSNSFSPPSNSNMQLFHLSMEGNKNKVNRDSEISSDSETDFYSLSESDDDPHSRFNASISSSSNSVCYPKSRPTVIIHSKRGKSIEGSELLNLTDYFIPDYQKKSHRPVPTTGTSAPMKSHQIDYSPSKMNFGSVGSSLVKYANKSFSWFKSSIDY
jgi:hypothetical protein